MVIVGGPEPAFYAEESPQRRGHRRRRGSEITLTELAPGARREHERSIESAALSPGSGRQRCTHAAAFVACDINVLLRRTGTKSPHSVPCTPGVHGMDSVPFP